MLPSSSQSPTTPFCAKYVPAYNRLVALPDKVDPVVVVVIFAGLEPISAMDKDDGDPGKGRNLLCLPAIGSSCHHHQQPILIPTNIH